MNTTPSNDVKVIFGQSGNAPERVELDVVKKRDTGLFVGAVYRLSQSPEGDSERVLTAVTLRTFVTARAAAQYINDANPGVKPVDIDSFPLEDEPDFPEVHNGQRITLVIPKHREDDEDIPRVMEARNEVMSYDQFRLLMDAERLQEETSSGDDLGLSCIYKEYIVKPAH